MDYKYTGVILGKYDVGETDRIYSFYAKEGGKIRALASGVRKPQAKLAGHLEPITLAEIFVAKKRGMGKITSAIAINNFPKIKSDLDSLQKAFYALNKINKFSIGEKDERIFDLLLEFLETMEAISLAGKKETKDIVALGFIFNLLVRLGYSLEVGHCVNCRKRLRPRNNFFSVSRGGVLCSDCHPAENEKIPMSDEAIKSMRIFMKNKIKNFTKLKISDKGIRSLKNIADRSIDWMLG